MTMMTDVTAPRNSGGRPSGSGGMIDTSCVRVGLSDTAGPMSGIAKMPSWANRLFGGPLMRSIDRLIGCSLFQSANVSRAAIRVESDVSWR